MKCTVCGRRNKGNSNFCGYCGNPLYCNNFETKQNGKVKQLLNKKWIKILSIILAVLIPVIAITGILLKSGLLSFNKRLDGRIEFKEFTKDDIAFENESLFVKNQLLITADARYSYSDIENIVSEYGGKIVGCIEYTNDYQVEFKEKGFNYLYTVKEMLENEFDVFDVEFHHVFTASNCTDPSTFYFNDYSQKEGNWWRNAIHLTDLEKKNYDYHNVKVGVYENIVDTNNPDISYAIDSNNFWYNDTSLLGDINASTHGTNVCGFLAAKKNNGIGIEGVANNVELYGYSYDRASNTSEFNKLTTVFRHKYFFSKMIYHGVKIINISAGFNEMHVAAQQGITNALNELNNIAQSLSIFFQKFINSGFEFVIVDCAGNLNSNGLGVDKHNWIRCEPSEDHSYGIKQYDSKDGELNSLTRLTDDIMYTADYDFLGVITDEKVRNRIIVVGSSTRDNTRADHSVNGERVDIYAPGENLTELSSGEDNGAGTSLAAPMVSGVVALMWGINPSLNADSIKYLLTSSATQQIIGEEYQISADSGDGSSVHKYLINAENAVERALNSKEPLVVSLDDNGTLLGYVKMVDDQGKVDNPNNVYEIYIYKGTKEDSYGELLNPDYKKPVAQLVETDAFGEFDVQLSPGSYYLMAAYHNGQYKSDITHFNIRQREVTYLDDIILYRITDSNTDDDDRIDLNGNEDNLPDDNTSNNESEDEEKNNRNGENGETGDENRNSGGSESEQVSQNETSEDANEKWKELYISFLNNYPDAFEFALVKLDEDEIPELIFMGSAATGTSMAWLHDDKIETKKIGYGDFKYLEKTGKFYCNYYNHGNIADSVYVLTNHQVCDVFSGRISNSVFRVNDECVTQDKYESMLKNAFNFDDAKTSSLYSKSIIIDEIKYKY